jgi:hypothetical protein
MVSRWRFERQRVAKTEQFKTHHLLTSSDNFSSDLSPYPGNRCGGSCQHRSRSDLCGRCPFLHARLSSRRSERGDAHVGLSLKTVTSCSAIHATLKKKERKRPGLTQARKTQTVSRILQINARETLRFPCSSVRPFLQMKPGPEMA